MGFFGGMKMSTSTSGLTPDTQAYLDAYRKMASGAFQGAPGSDMGGSFADLVKYGSQTGLNGVNDYYNPFETDVIGGLHQDFDRQRAMADKGAGSAAIGAGAFGGSREAVLRALALRDVNQSEANTTAGVRQAGYSDAVNNLFRDRSQAGAFGMQGLQFLDDRTKAQLQAMIPGIELGGHTQSTPYYDQGIFGQLLGAGATVAGAALGGGIPGLGGGGKAGGSFTPSAPSFVPQTPGFGYSNPSYSFPTNRYF